MSLNPADTSFTAHLGKVLPDGVLRPPESRYLEEPRRIYAGQVGVLALPRNVDQVSVLVRAANEARVPVVPCGGGTGLVGGQVMPDGPAPLVVSLEKMNAIRGAYQQENVLVVEAGAILADVQAAARAEDRLFPLSLAAEGTAQIGGNLSTNAGGVNVLRYGTARDLCLGLEAVLPNGEIWHGLSRLRKDNSGYDLRGLLIGAEGTLGVITAATLKLSPIPAVQGTAMLVVPSPQAAITLLALGRDQMGEAISAFELIHRQGLVFLAEALPQIRQPFATLPEWCVLIELGMARGQDPEAALTDLFETALDAGLVLDGVIAQSEARRGELWMVREQIPEANRLVGSVSSHDISVPISAIPEFIRRGGEAIAALGPFRINCFGHLGDGNLHYNIFPAHGRSCDHHYEQRQEVQRAVYDLVHELGGSFSAEHGIGRMKVAAAEYYGDRTRLAAMRVIKQALDPNGIMNPGAVLTTTR